MEIRLGWAIVAGIALGGAVAWWELGHPGYETLDQKVAAADQGQADGKKAKSATEPALYRWHDADGVLQLTDHPPKGRKYEKVKLREDQNIIPMSSVINPPSKQAPKKPGDG